MKLLLALPIALVSLVPGLAPAAPTGLLLTYDMSGSPLTITRGAVAPAGQAVFQLDGFPAPGLILYDKPTPTALGVVYYQHPSLPGWLKVAEADLTTATQRPTLALGAPWQPYLGQPTRRYDVKLGEDVCDSWFASPAAADVAGLNAADLVFITAAVQFMNAGTAADACERLALPMRQGFTVGLPLRLNGPNGPWVLDKLEAASVADINLPTTARPLSDDDRLHILLAQLSSTERTQFAEAHAGQPLAAQLAALEALLATSTMP